ncbi:MAG: S41 family peptidase [Christensenellaceae bacterium]|nr:S41 family peptidase [Christensenellaceae bacterium]MEA5065788.1 S41 family peptidase [Eubacteriales bacterium]MEA5067749.1 S41 family peptidase [Christensenellaceae bacterium]
MRKRTIVILAVVWMVVLVAGVSSAVTMALVGALPGPSAGDAMRVTQQEYERLERYERLDEVFRELKGRYYTELNEDELVLGAVRGMAASAGDPYTFYYTPEEMNEMVEHSKGLYEGVGLLLSGDKAGNVVVLRVFHGSPAHEAGVLPGDIVLKVNEQEVSARTDRALDEAIGRIKRDESETTMLTIRRGKELLTIGMGKRAVRIDPVQYEVLEDSVGYIVIYQFMGDDVGGFKQAVRALKDAGVTRLIIDVRSNPGGLLSDVVDICDQLMGQGLIVYTQDRDGRREDYFSDAALWDVPIAVLVNSMSASASEILAGALKDAGRAIIVGENTFGKGIVQTLVTFKPDGAGMQLTTARYFTPSGKSIHGVGIAPDIKVELTGEAPLHTGVNLVRDSQLKAAYDALVGGRQGY